MLLLDIEIEEIVRLGHANDFIVIHADEYRVVLNYKEFRVVFAAEDSGKFVARVGDAGNMGVVRQGNHLLEDMFDVIVKSVDSL